MYSPLASCTGSDGEEMRMVCHQKAGSVRSGGLIDLSVLYTFPGDGTTFTISMLRANIMSQWIVKKHLIINIITFIFSVNCVRPQHRAVTLGGVVAQYVAC